MNKWEKAVQQSLLDSEEAAMKELERQYKSALISINEKVKLFQADIDLLDQALNQEGLDETTKAVLLSQKRSKIYQQQFQQSLKSQVGGIIDKLHSDSYTTIDKYLKGCYETGYIGTMYDIAKQGIPLIMPLNQAAVVKAVLTDSKIKKGYYEHLGVDHARLKKVITQQISRGIASSLPYSDIARNINNASKSGLYNAKRIARTEGHRIQQTSARDAQEAAKARGADVVKQWDASLDGRTRDSHRRVDGEIRELDEKFSNGLMFPGDPHGSAEEVINCRCTCNTRARWALDEEELQTLKERAEYFGLDKAKSFEEYREKFLTASQKMAAQSQGNDWSGTVAEALTKHKKNEVIKYAKDLDVELGDIDSFDGDIDLLKAEISTVSKVCKDYGLKTRVIVSARVLEDDNDFAITDGHRIIFNSKALRNRKITEENIAADNYFASKVLEDIALHEVGHIVAIENSINGLAIAKKAYYNLTGNYLSTKQLTMFMDKEVSKYVSDETLEIVAEVIVANKNRPTDFTKEFVSLLKGVTNQ